MKPSGVLIETCFGEESVVVEVQRSSIIMSPDSPDGFFFALVTGGKRLELPVELADAQRFQKTKSEAVKKRILDRYVVTIPETNKYGFPYGAYVGSISVGSVLEVNVAQAAKPKKKFRG
jgi:hypothetical protein